MTTASECPFCALSAESSHRVLAENEYCWLIYDGYPVTPGHSLVIPKRHVPDCFDLTPEELVAVHELVAQGRHLILNLHHDVKGFNIGVNVGLAAGQTVLHCHFHLIPRRDEDVSNPRGGVRNVIPGRGDY